MKTFSVLAYINPSKVEAQISDLIPYIETCVTENNNDYINYSLEVIKHSFKSSENPSTSAKMEADRISKFLTSAMNHHQARIVSETLTATGLFILQLKGPDGSIGAEHQAVVMSLKEGIFNKLQKQDIDQEVKQNSIIAMAQLLTVSYKQLQAAEINQIV